MLKLTKTGIGLLTNQYRSVLRKCLLMNLGVLMCFCSRANASIEISYDATDLYDYGKSYASIWYGHYTTTAHAIWYTNLVTLEDLSDYYTKQEVNNIQSLNYYYTKTEADAEYALLEAAIEDVDDKVEDVDDKVDAVEAKIGSLNETGIAGNDVATQLKYILENGSTGGAGVALSTLGYIGANTPYLNTTSNAMNFSSTYTIGGNMSTLANQIKTNETNIDNLSSRINSLSTYSGTLDLTDNYAKVIGDVNPQTNHDALVNDGINTKAYATPNKSYTVEFSTIYEVPNSNGAMSNERFYRIQIGASSQEAAIAKAKDEIINNGWSSSMLDQSSINAGNRYVNKYMYATEGFDGPVGASNGIDLELNNDAIRMLTNDQIMVTENNYTVTIIADNRAKFEVDVNIEDPDEALSTAKEIINTGYYQDANDNYSNIYYERKNKIRMKTQSANYWIARVDNASVLYSDPDLIEDGDAGYSFNGSSLLENVAILDSAIGDLSATGVSGASVAAQLKLLGEVGSEALGQKIGSWSTTKDSISQTLGEETKNYGYLTAFEYDSENEQYIGTVGDNLQALDTALSLTAKGLDALSHQLLNYYYTKTEADARYALLDTIGDVDYSDEAADEGSALKNGAEDSPTTVRGALDLLDTKIGSLNETGIAGDDVATQLKYILENGSTGGAGVTLSTLGYIGANTPYLNTTNEAMNFSSTYTIGGNLSTLANQIKTNETNIDNLSSRINSLSTYSGTLDLTDNYAKVIGDVNPQTNTAGLVNDGINTKAYATPNKSYTVELDTNDAAQRQYRIQVIADNETQAVVLAKEEIINNGWTNNKVTDPVLTENRYQNKYEYASAWGLPVGITDNDGDDYENATSGIQNATVTVTENNYTAKIKINGYNAYFTADIHLEEGENATDKAQEIISSGFYITEGGSTENRYYDGGALGSSIGISSWRSSISNNTSLSSIDAIEIGDVGYSFDGYSLLENVAILDSAIGDLSATGVSGASVAAQLQLLGEVGSEALGQKVGSWSTTKDSISQTLGEETKNYGYLTAFEYDSENEQYVGTVGDNLQALDSALSLTAKGLDALSYDLYNYYYTFRVDERTEVTDSASFFQKDFSTLQEVDLHIKNPTHLGAFAKCDEVCPRLSERFASSLSQEQMFRNDASVDAGTFSICSLQIENVNEKLSNVFDV